MTQEQNEQERWEKQEMSSEQQPAQRWYATEDDASADSTCWLVVEDMDGGGAVEVALTWNKRRADQIVAEHAKVKCYEVIRQALPKGFINLRIEPDDELDDFYVLRFDGNWGDKGGPLLESYYRPLLEAILAALRPDGKS